MRIDTRSEDLMLQHTPIISQQQLDVLRHALGIILGRDGAGGRRRNHFATGAGGRDHFTCMSLVDVGMMQRHAGSVLSGGDDVFVVTAAGRAAAKPRPAERVRTTRSQRRYDLYLRTDSNMTFGQWLKTSPSAR